MYNFDEPVDRKNTDCIKYDSLSKFFNTTDAIPMWVADMDFKTAPCIIDAMSKRLQHGVFGYSIKPARYYTSIVNWMQTQNNWAIKSDWISFSPGVVAGFSLAIDKLTKPGDKIIVQPPVYFPFFTSAQSLNRQVIYNPLKIVANRLCIDFDDFEQKVSQGVAMFLLCNPHNPGGSVWTRAELEKLASICQKYNVTVVSDEIHSDIVFEPNRHIPFASISNWALNNSVTVLSHSKTFNVAGLTTSYVIIPNQQMLKKYNMALNALHLDMGNIFGTEALIAAYTNGHQWLAELKKYLKNNIDYTLNFFKNNCNIISCIEPESTFLIWLDCRKLKLSSEQLKDLFYNKAKVAVNEGSLFGPGGQGFVRLNIGCTKKTLTCALNNIAQAINITN